VEGVTTNEIPAEQWLKGKDRAMEQELAALVAINSFTDNVDGGRLMADALTETFRLEGLRLTRTPSARFADHLVFASDGAPGVAPIALVGHLDTVFPPGTFEGYKRDGDLGRGPGVLDMKGGLLVVAYALRALALTEGLLALPPLRVVIVSDEEVGSPEGQRIIQESIKGSQGCLVFEAGRKLDAIITRRKGTGGVTATAHGKAAHAGNNHKEGVNAVRALARFVEQAELLTDYARGVTVNVGMFHGGDSKNTVPDRAEAKLDLRFETKADADALMAALHQAAAACDLPGARIELSGGVARLPMERSAESAQLLLRYGAQAKAVGLGSGEASLIGGGSDASTSSAMGIASIDGLGPRGIGFHTKDEQIELGTLILKAQALARFLRSLGR
jgi:glutamate carboxypeptidase